MKLISVFILSLGISALADCDFLQKYPHKEERVLSNGTRVPVPTHTTNLDSFILIGTIDNGAASELLKPFGLKPLGPKALGALSVFDYKKSDIGAFRESYFVVLAHDPKKPRQPALFHV
ncbi:MAG: hypothetical protein ABL958_21160, partial [Bdellovibrionia bacterium]